jgi:hypothetical protein
MRGGKIQKLNLKKAIGAVLLSILACVGILLIFVREDVSGLFNAIASSDWRLVLLAVGMFFLEVGIWTSRWRVALRASGYKLSFRDLYPISLGSQFITNITPTLKSGGEPFRAYFANKTCNVPYEVGFGTILADGLLSVPPTAVFFLAGLLIWFLMNQVSTWAVFGVILGATVFIMVFLPIAHKLLKKEVASRTLGRIVGWFQRHFGGKTSKRGISSSMKKFYASSRFAIEHKRAAATMILLSFALLTLTVARIYVIFLALGLAVHEVSWAIPLLGATIPSILGLVPFLPGGLVLVETGMVGVFILCGINPVIAASVVLIERGISYVLSTLVGAGVLSYLGVKMWKS